MGDRLPFLGESPATIRPVEHRPDPEKRPKDVERKKAHPARGVDRILMRMMAAYRHLVGNVMNGNDRVEQNEGNDDQYPESEIVEKHVLLPCMSETRNLLSILVLNQRTQPCENRTLQMVFKLSAVSAEDSYSGRRWTALWLR